MVVDSRERERAVPFEMGDGGRGGEGNRRETGSMGNGVKMNFLW